MCRVQAFVVGAVLIVLGLSGFVCVQKAGWFHRDKPLAQVVQNATERGGQITARQKQAELKKILDATERTGKLDELAFRTAIGSAGQYANLLDDLYNNWKRQHLELAIDGHSDAGNSSPQKPQSVVADTPARSQANNEPPAERDRKRFFRSEVHVDSTNGWTRVATKHGPVALSIEGDFAVLNGGV